MWSGTQRISYQVDRPERIWKLGALLGVDISQDLFISRGHLASQDIFHYWGVEIATVWQDFIYFWLWGLLLEISEWKDACQKGNVDALLQVYIKTQQSCSLFLPLWLICHVTLDMPPPSLALSCKMELNDSSDPSWNIIDWNAESLICVWGATDRLDSTSEPFLWNIIEEKVTTQGFLFCFT